MMEIKHERFGKFLLSSLSATAIDLLLFMMLWRLFEPLWPTFYVAAATVIARIVSATYNCIINYKRVFESSRNLPRALLRFAILACFIMLTSATLVSFGVHLLPNVMPVIIKMVVDAGLFFVNYNMQKRFVF